MGKVDGIGGEMSGLEAERGRALAAGTSRELIHVNPVSRHHVHCGNKEERSKIHNTVTSYTDSEFKFTGLLFYSRARSKLGI